MGESAVPPGSLGLWGPEALGPRGSKAPKLWGFGAPGLRGSEALGPWGPPGPPWGAGPSALA